MSSTRESCSGFTSTMQPPRWSHHDSPALNPLSDIGRRATIAAEPLRPIEPGSMHSAPIPYLPARIHDGDPNSKRQQLPGVQELLSPSVRTGARSPFSGSWAPINPPPTWQNRSHSTSNGPGQHPLHTPYRPLQSPSHGPRLDMFPPETQRPASMHPSLDNDASRRPSLPVMALRKPPLSSPVTHEHPHLLSQAPDFLSSPSYHPVANSGVNMRDHLPEQRSNSIRPGKTNAAGGIFSLQVVGQRDIPGEGLCYVFKDGSTCPTIIDGESVNPLWGTTKAGKARKRLAQACLNCREKKIKCEPGETSCLQCEKAKRECLRPPVSQSQAELATGMSLSMAGSSTGQGDWQSQSPSDSDALPELPAPKRRRHSPLADDQHTIAPQSRPDTADSDTDYKRQKSEQPKSPSVEQIIDRPRKDSKRPFTDETESLLCQSYAASSEYHSWDEDPHHLEPDGTKRFLDLFFRQAAHELRLLFPRKAFTRWATECNSKCQRECMVLYAVLALGSVFSSEHSRFAKVCIERATQAIGDLYGGCSMALVQARLLVSAYNHLKGKDGLAWDYSGSALRLVGAMKLNTEEGCSTDLDEYSRRYYNFTRDQLNECRRRTFWSAFLTDAYNSFCSGLLSTVNDDDVYIRLPCNEQDYEDGLASAVSFFDGSNVPTDDALSPAAYTIAVSSIWKEAIRFFYRSTYLPAPTYAAKHDIALDRIRYRLSQWHNSLPIYLRYSWENLERAVCRGYAGDFLSLHSLHLITHLKAARMVRHDLLAPAVVARNICTAHSYALKILALVRDIRALTPPSSTQDCKTTDFISPFIAYAVTLAIDTLGAGGLREEIVAARQVVSTAVTVLRELAQYSDSAWAQLKRAEKRLHQMDLLPTESDSRPGKGADGHCWRIAEPMEKPPTLEQDVMYGVPASRFYDALLEGRKR